MSMLSQQSVLDFYPVVESAWGVVTFNMQVLESAYDHV